MDHPIRVPFLTSSQHNACPGSGEKKKKSAVSKIPPTKRAIDGSSARDAKASDRSTSQESSTFEPQSAFESEGSDESESTDSQSLQSEEATGRRSIKKRGRSGPSESEGEVDPVRPKRLRVRGRVEGHQESRLSPQTVKPIPAFIVRYFHTFSGASDLRGIIGQEPSPYCRKRRTAVEVTSHETNFVLFLSKVGG